MKVFRYCFLPLLIVLILTGCGNPDSNHKDKTAKTEKRTTESADNKSDTLPLLQIMINLEQNMNALQAGIWRENYDRIEKASEGIGNHAKIPKNQIKIIKAILGPKEFKQFVSDDKTVHQTALKIAEAARQEKFKKITELYKKLNQGCVSCHINYRSTIRNSPKW